MSTLWMVAYAATALVFLGHAAYWLVTVKGRRHRRLEGADLVLLGGVALLSSALWIVLVPVYATGWVSAGHGRRALARVRELVRVRHPAGSAHYG